jgi:hypothetical protein
VKLSLTDKLRLRGQKVYDFLKVTQLVRGISRTKIHLLTSGMEFFLLAK